MAQGKIVKVSGPVIIAKEMKGSQMYEVVRVGEGKLIGEIIELEGDKATIQVYEETTGLRPGEAVIGTRAPLSVELGPGILKNFFDGIQRPLEVIRSKSGIFISRGMDVPPLDRGNKWGFKPTAKKGSKVTGGDILGEVQETDVIKQKILVPPGVEGELIKLADEGNYKIEEAIALVKTKEGEKELSMLQRWPVRRGRPYKEKLDPNLPLITGQRVIDTFFPVAKGGTSAIPGGFGTGKTVMGHQLARWSDAKIYVYVGCGERGNEMTEVVEDFPKLIDPYTGKPLMERTVLIANTSNMPVAAREACVYTGITLAEYYRDMGYDVALTADSTSRWAEAMREISGRLEEMPGEEGYPAYLASRLAEFYERSGRVLALGSDERYGSITVTGAVSPPGGDFSEPVTQNTLRITKVFWALDSALADRRHFPSINWLRSYSLYLDSIQGWWTSNIAKDWLELRTKAMALLQKEAELMEIVKLVGPDALPERERVVLEGARIIREDFLQQSALDEIDIFCSSKKQYNMLSLMLKFYDKAMDAVSKGVPAKEIAALEVLDDIARMKYVPEKNVEKTFGEIREKIEKQMNALIEQRELVRR